MFDSIITNLGTSITFQEAMICMGVGLGLGLLISVAYMLSGKHTSSFSITLVMLPPLVALVIMLVNGNAGAGLAVAGAFALVRFRSTPGSAREICVIFFAMAIGLACGMGYVKVAAVSAVALSILLFVLSKFGFGSQKASARELKITIPENLDYTTVFEDLFQEYTSSVSLEAVKTTNLGSLYQLTYLIVMKDEKKEKEFIDALRCRNGNLTIACARPLVRPEDL